MMLGTPGSSAIRITSTASASQRELAAALVGHPGALQRLREAQRAATQQANTQRMISGATTLGLGRFLDVRI